EVKAAAPAVEERRAVEETPVDQSFALLQSAIQKHEKEAAGAAAAVAAPAAPKPVADEPEVDDESAKVNRACREPLNKLVEELNLCRRYYESTFPEKAIDRLIFIGGEARQRSLCQQVAREMGLAAQIGDPLVRIGRISDIGIESGIDRRVPQPGWAVALGLSMGPRAGAKV